MTSYCFTIQKLEILRFYETKENRIIALLRCVISKSLYKIFLAHPKNFLQEYFVQNAVLKMSPNNDKYFKSKINFLLITRKNI